MSNNKKKIIIFIAIILLITIVGLGIYMVLIDSEIKEHKPYTGMADVLKKLEEFQKYEGNEIKGSDLKNLYELVLTNNLHEENKISIKANGDSISNLNSYDTTLPKYMGEANLTYKVSIEYNSENGSITNINIEGK